MSVCKSLRGSYSIMYDTFEICNILPIFTNFLNLTFRAPEKRKKDFGLRVITGSNEWEGPCSQEQGLRVLTTTLGASGVPIQLLWGTVKSKIPGEANLTRLHDFYSFLPIIFFCEIDRDKFSIDYTTFVNLVLSLKSIRVDSKENNWFSAKCNCCL